MLNTTNAAGVKYSGAGKFSWFDRTPARTVHSTVRAPLDRSTFVRFDADDRPLYWTKYNLISVIFY
jgi:hypothetical protein